jgi:hypothetical protein
MRSTFNIKEYLQSLSVDLVNAFAKAGQATHPGAVGSGREKSVKDQLQRVLPSGVGVGSGFVIDSYGNTSVQCDIIVYERDLALKFAPNDDDLYTYYSCECVIAVGQVKSDASIKDVRDSILNLKSVRELKRLMSPNTSSFRKYLTTMSMAGAPEEQYSPTTKSKDQIYTFLICKSFKTPVPSMLQVMKEEAKEKLFFPNRILSTENQYGLWIVIPQANPALGALEANGFTMQTVDCALGQLIMELTVFVSSGRTVPLNNAVYLPNLNGLKLTEPVYSLDFIEEQVHGE